VIRPALDREAGIGGKEVLREIIAPCDTELQGEKGEAGHQSRGAEAD
jgi:hypothetical protein